MCNVKHVGRGRRAVIAWLFDLQLLWFRTPLMAICTTLCDKVCQWLKTLLSSTNKTFRHDIAEILLKVGLNTTTLTRWERIHVLFRFPWKIDIQTKQTPKWFVWYAKQTFKSEIDYLFCAMLLMFCK
jgi:hypothetical protein